MYDTKWLRERRARPVAAPAATPRAHQGLHLDVKNAFNTQHRFAFLKEVYAHFPALLPLCAQFYSHESDLLIWGKDGKVRVLKSRSGQQQGDTLGSFLFCLGIQPILNAVHAKWPGLLVRAICDDIHVAGPDAEVAQAFAFLRDELAKIGLELSYGPEKTCCLLPSLEDGDDAESSERRRLLGRYSSALPSDVVRLGGGMEVLGSFVGADEWVAAAVLAKVENLSDAKSIAYACAELSSLAASRALNARDVAGSLLRTCVVPKLGYLCRTVRPDLLLSAARSADNIVARTFCAVFHVNHSIFGSSATAEQRLAAARVRLPTSLAGVGLRSMVTNQPGGLLRVAAGSRASNLCSLLACGERCAREPVPRNGAGRHRRSSAARHCDREPRGDHSHGRRHQTAYRPRHLLRQAPSWNSASAHARSGERCPRLRHRDCPPGRRHARFLAQL